MPSPTQHSPPANPFDIVSEKKEKRYQPVRPCVNLCARDDTKITVVPQASKDVIIFGKTHCNGETVVRSFSHPTAEFSPTAAPYSHTDYDNAPQKGLTY